MLGDAFFPRDSPQAEKLWAKAQDAIASARRYFVIGGRFRNPDTGLEVEWKAKIDVDNCVDKDELITRYYKVVRRVIARVAEKTRG